jgi:elongation factor 1 alpha-like protein
MEKTPGSGIGRGLGITQTFGEARKLSALELGYFLDSPWGNIPEERKGILVFEDCEPKGGLLGGSSTKASSKEGKVSKLAALAKAKKQKSATISGEQRSTTSLLSRLSQKGQNEDTQAQHESSGLGQRTAEQALAADGRADQLLPQPKSPAPEEEQTPPQNIVKRELVEEESSPLRATPSTFAHSMFGEKLDAYTKMFVADGRMFDVVGVNTNEKKSAFVEPSPDDIVLAAQSRRQGTDNSNKS